MRRRLGMFLYHLTLSRAAGIQVTLLCTRHAAGLHHLLFAQLGSDHRFPPQCAVYGNFSAPKAQEIIVSRGNVLELLRPDDSGRLQTVFSTDVFGCIRALAPFRLTGATRDYLIVGSDSGRLVICEYLKEQNTFKKVHQETFGKSGCRRIVPGQFLAVDPKGRACLTGAGPGSTAAVRLGVGHTRVQ